MKTFTNKKHEKNFLLCEQYNGGEFKQLAEFLSPMHVAPTRALKWLHTAILKGGESGYLESVWQTEYYMFASDGVKVFIVEAAPQKGLRIQGLNRFGKVDPTKKMPDRVLAKVKEFADEKPVNGATIAVAIADSKAELLEWTRGGYFDSKTVVHFNGLPKSVVFDVDLVLQTGADKFIYCEWSKRLYFTNENIKGARGFIMRTVLHEVEK